MVQSPATAAEPERMTTDHPDDALGQTALDWLLRLQAHPEDAALKAACQAWQAAAPEHARAWHRAERLWRLSSQLQPSTTHAWPAPPAPLPIPRRHRVRKPWLATGSAMVAALLLALIPAELPWQPDYSNPAGPAQRIDLEDGSTLWLRGDTALDLNFGAGRRGIEIRHGEVFLEVRRDPQRPFVVLAGDSQVVVTGTAFSVDLEERHLAVAVEHGSVRVESPGASKELGAGDWLDIDRQTSQVRNGQQPAGQVAAWRRNQLVADDQRIGDLLEALRRHNPHWILLLDPQLAELRVTGLYDLGDPQASLQAMVQPHGGRVERWSPWLLVVKRR